MTWFKQRRIACGRSYRAKGLTVPRASGRAEATAVRSVGGWEYSSEHLLEDTHSFEVNRTPSRIALRLFLFVTCLSCNIMPYFYLRH